MKFFQICKRSAVIQSLLVILIIAAFLYYAGGKTGYLYAGADLRFHVNRMYEIQKNLETGHLLPTISTFSANQVGSFVIRLYPQMPVYIGAILLMVFPPVFAMYLFMGLQIFLGFLVCKYVARKFYLDQLNSTFVAITYALCIPLLSRAIQQWLMGEVWAISFMPLVILGFVGIVSHSNETDDAHQIVSITLRQSIVALALGMGLVLFCHILSFVILCFFLGIGFVIALCLAKQKWLLTKSMVAAGVLGGGFTAYFWLPLLLVFHNNRIANPIILKDLPTWASPDLQQFLGNVMGLHFSTDTTGLIVLIALFIFLVTYHKQTRLTKWLAATCLLVTVSESKEVWQYLYWPPLSQIQFPNRMLGIVFFLGSLLLGLSVVAAFSNRRQSQHYFLFVVALFAIGISFVSVKNEWLPMINHDRVAIKVKPSKHHLVDTTTPDSFKVNNHEFHYLMGYWTNYGATDYWPKATNNDVSLIDHVVKRDGKKGTAKLHPLPNGMRYQGHFDAHSTVVLPFVMYHGRYQVTDQQGHPLQYHVDKHAQLVVKTKQQTSAITVYRPVELSTYLALAMSVLTAICLIVLGYQRPRKSMKH
ncbi:hypothetical protein [Furfurilactobacillus entadae]|uniref:hypothetical protein n=1 Tax=Furfurilactobacillus entadae TaxID=2922307 RepID=UPI0035E72096